MELSSAKAEVNCIRISLVTCPRLANSIGWLKTGAIIGHARWLLVLYILELRIIHLGIMAPVQRYPSNLPDFIQMGPGQHG